jgi:hypothetical protein
LETLLSFAKRYSIKLDQHKGDMVFLNNLSILHARDAYVDDPVHGRNRHLLRLSLRDNELAWPKPDGYREILDKKFAVRAQEQRLMTLEEVLKWAEPNPSTTWRGYTPATTGPPKPEPEPEPPTPPPDHD